MTLYHDADTFAAVEPRITHIKRQIERLLTLVELEKDGHPVQIDGFRLRTLSAWRDYNTSNAFDAIVPISGVCNSHCHFCFEENIPFPREKSLISEIEARTRLKYYSMGDGQALFSSSRPHMEPFVHPNALNLIESARECDSDSVFWITTNGSYLTNTTVTRLAQLKPIMIKLSVNSSDPAVHGKIMGLGKRTPTALAAPSVLQSHNVPFIASVVAWPDISLQCIEQTIRHVSAFMPYAVRIRLPLIHRWHRQQPRADLKQHWIEVDSFARQLRADISPPLLVEPCFFSNIPIIPAINGIVLNSPAYHEGLRYGDVILSIDGCTVLTRTAADGLLTAASVQRRAVDITVRRNDCEITRSLDLSANTTYPYDHKHLYSGQNFGIILVEDFPLRCVAEMLDIVDAYKARCVLAIMSPLLHDALDTLLNSVPEFQERIKNVAIYIEHVADNSFGGNFSVGECRMVNDYVSFVRRRQADGLNPDLIIIPQSFGSAWGVDLLGHSFTEIAMRTGVPVQMVELPIVYGRDA